MADEVQKDESAAEPAHVTNEARQIAFAQVMAEVHGECYVGEWQRVANCIGLAYRNRCGNGRARGQVHAGGFHTEPVHHVLQNHACGASYVQDSTDRQRIPPNGSDHESCVTQPLVNSSEIAVSALDQVIGDVN